jgi:sugar phosphate permease
MHVLDLNSNFMIAAAESRQALLPYRWELVLWLWVAFFFNQADRQLFGIVLPSIQRDLGLTSVEAGLVATLFTIAYACVIPFSGIAGDRFSRKRIVVLSILTWSVATTLTGFGSSLLYLVLIRSVATGGGEALFAPSAYALIGEQHVETRARAMSVHQTSLYVGVVATGAVAGYVADRFGWRGAFWIFGGAGVAAAAAMQARLRQSTVARRATEAQTWAGVGRVLRTRTAMALAVGLGSSVFVNIGYLTWMPTYLHERFHLSLAEAGFFSMFYHHAFAFAGVLIGGPLADKLARRRPGVRLPMQAAALLAGVPFLYLMGAAGSPPLVYFALAGFGLFRGLYDCNTWAAVYQVIPPPLHASASGLILAIGFGIASLAPVLLGFIRQSSGLAAGLSGLGAAHAIGAATLAIAAWRWFGPDYRRGDLR